MSYQPLKESIDAEDEFEMVQRQGSSVLQGLRISKERPGSLVTFGLAMVIVALVMSNTASVISLTRTQNSRDAHAHSKIPGITDCDGHTVLTLPSLPQFH